MKKKSASQIKRMQKRAAARGEKYTSPSLKLSTATKLRATLLEIESNAYLNSKDRRSAKRKAEAIAAEEAGCPASELMKLHDEHSESDKEKSKEDKTAAHEGDMSYHESDGAPSQKRKKSPTPYILFVGQLSYATTKDGLFRHFQKELGKKEITDDTIRIRLLTHAKKPNISRGMAFVETSDPELMYECLKLHHTHLDGRRINVERSAGGNKNSEARQSKIKQFRTDQQEFMEQTVDKILSDYKSSGDIDDGELDEGVISLCKRHSAATVTAALAEYVEARGRQMDNPSAYLTHIVGRVAVEGVAIDARKTKYKNKGNGKRSNSTFAGAKKQLGSYEESAGVGTAPSSVLGNKLQDSSDFAKAGIDLSFSEGAANGAEKTNEISQIFPSFGRGRGRGRGYM